MSSSNDLHNPVDATAPKHVAIVLSSSGNGGSGKGTATNLVVWTCTPTIRTSMDDSLKYSLEYTTLTSMSDQPNQFTGLDALLTSLCPLKHNTLYLSCTSTSTSSSDSRRLAQLSTYLQQRRDLVSSSTSNTSDTDDEPAANSPDEPQLTIVTPPSNSNNKSNPQCLLDQIEALLHSDHARLQFQAHVELNSTSNPLLLDGLALLLNAQVHDEWMGHCRLQPMNNTHTTLRLDRTAMDCLHLLPPANAGVASVVGGHSSNNSLYGILAQHGKTKSGKALLETWLRQPLRSVVEIERRQEAIALLLEHGGTAKDAVRNALTCTSSVDCSKLSQVLGHYSELLTDTEDFELDSTKKPLQALYDLHLLSSTVLPNVLDELQVLETSTDSMSPNNESTSSSLLVDDLVRPLLQVAAELSRANGLAEQVLDLDEACRGNFLVQPSFVEGLSDIHADLCECQTQALEEQQVVQDLYHLSDVKLEEESNNGGSWHFRLKDSNDLKTLQSLPEDSLVKVHKILKNGVYFSTEKLRQLSCQHDDLSQQYSMLSKGIVLDALKIAVTYETVVQRLAFLLSHLDALQCMAQLVAASPYPYCRPTLTDSDAEGAGIVLTQARHPCVELQEGVEFMPNDITLKFGGTEQFCLCTGPNMGGKSTYLRSVGACVTLAQIGCWVPCDSATLNVCDAILCRVGAGDLQERGISTFMAEMLESSSILQTATQRSLILVDELGRGTSTFDGYGLARAISEYLLEETKCLVVFATHFHELTAMPKITNVHVTATQHESQGLCFLYQVHPGPCLESFGIAVAQLANVPQVVIDDAKRKALQLENFQYHKHKQPKRSDNNNNSTEEPEEIDEDMEFLQNCVNLNVDAFLEQEFESDQARGAALKQLLCA